MKKFTTSVLVISIAMMGTLSLNASAKGPDNNRRSDGPRIENRNHRPSGKHGDNAFHPGNKGGNPGAHNGNYNRPMAGNPGHNPGYHPGHNPGHNHGIGHRPAPAPRPAVRPAPRPRPVPVHHRHHSHRPAGYRAARIVGDAIITAAAITAANAIVGAIVNALPPYYTELVINGRVFYLADNVLYSPVVINGVPCFEIVNNRYFY